MAYPVFISYSHVDRAAAEGACAALEAKGIRCWIAPRDIPAGAEWAEAIIEALDQSVIMVLVFSANANASRQVRREAEHAVSKGVTIVPLRIEAVTPARSLAYFLAGVQWFDALAPPLEAHFQRLAMSLKTFLETAASERRTADPEFTLRQGDSRRAFGTAPAPVPPHAPGPIQSEAVNRSFGFGAIAIIVVAIIGLIFVFATHPHSSYRGFPGGGSPHSGSGIGHRGH